FLRDTAQCLSFGAVFQGNHIANLLQEPRIYLGDIGDLFNRGAQLKGVTDVEHAIPVGLNESLAHLLAVQLFVAVGTEAGAANLQRLESFVECFREISPDGHGFAYSLHLRSKFFIHIRKLLEVKARRLHDDVIDRRLKTSGSVAGNGIGQLIQIIADRQFCGNLGNGISCSFGGQGRRSAYARINFNGYEAVAARLHSKLHIAAAGKSTNGAHHFNGGVAQHLELLVGKRLRRRHRYRVAGVYTHRVNIFDRADDDDVVVFITQQLKLIFFPAKDRLLDEHAVDGTHFQPAAHFAFKLIFRPHDPAAGPAHGKGGTNHNRKSAQFFGNFLGLQHRLGRTTLALRDINLIHKIPELLAVFGNINCGNVYTNNLDVSFTPIVFLLQIARQIQPGLPAHGRQYGVRLLLFNNFFDRFNGQRIQVNFIGHHWIGHDGSRI